MFESRLLLTFHLWKIDQVFSSADGKEQFIELHDPVNGESHTAGHFISSNENTFTFPADLPSDNTANQHFLIATASYAALPGAVTPDYIIPDNFFNPSGDTLDYADVDEFSFTASQMPTDGVNSLMRNFNTFALSTGANSESNLAGQTASVTVAAQPSGYLQVNLVSDQVGDALIQDPNLVNPWGAALPAQNAGLWVSDNGTGVTTIYSGDVAGSPFDKVPLTVTIPGGAPTGQVANSTSDFSVSSGSASGAASFIFASQNGNITGWNFTVPAPPSTQAQLAATTTGAVYKGIALANNGTANQLYAANFNSGHIDVFDASFHPVTLSAGAFTDPNLPAGYAPFNIVNLGGQLYVTYALQDSAKQNDVAGFGHGFVDIYDTSGNLVKRLITGIPGNASSPLDSPWGLAIAPANFGDFSGDLLVGNFGNGKINAFDPSTGAFKGTLSDASGNPIVIDGLWDLQFGNGTTTGNSNTLFFTAGTNGQQDGLVGAIVSAANTPLTGDGASLKATEGAAQVSGTVAAFSSSNTTAQASAFTATIDWGDGTTSTGTVTSNNDGGFNVTGHHTYADEGTETIHVTVSDGTNALTLNGSATIADAALSATGVPISLTKGLALTNVAVATFTDAGGTEPDANYSATINWGDGTTGAGTVTGSGATLTVTGSHTYAADAASAVSVTVKDEGGATATATTTAQAGYLQVNLVSDQAGSALITDPNLVNPWGVALSPTGPFWISDNGSNVATIYSGDVNGSPLSQAGLVVSIPGGAPTGQVANTTSDFVVGSGSASGPAFFIFASESGSITGWNPAAGVTQAQTAVTVPGAVYKGLALANNGTANELFATNFAAGTIDVFDASFHQVTLPAGAFTDPNLPAGFAPFGIQLLNGNLYVSYAKQDAAKHDDVAGFGNGFIDVYNTGGTLLQRLVTGIPGNPTSPLNSPWGMTIAPANFGDFAGDLLVGNFGNGWINAFDPAHGTFLGSVTDASGNPIVIDGLWNLVFGNGTAAGSTNTLFFTAGSDGEQHGLFGEIVSAVSSPLTGDGTKLTVTEGAAFSGAVAAFASSNTAALASAFTATIDWGDGSTSAGTVVSNNDGGFNVAGSQLYAAAAANEAIQVTISDGTNTITLDGSATVKDAPLTATGMPVSLLQGLTLNNVTVATFTDPGAIQTYSTVPSNGDVNPYGVAIVPSDFPTGGVLQPGDTLVANFNNSGNTQGTGTTITRITPSGQQSTFFTSTALGLDSLVVLKSGFVIVGNVPTAGNGTIGPGSLQVLDANGHLVATITNANFLDDPWGLAVNDQGSTAQLFVSNVSGTTGANGTVTRVDLSVPAGGTPQVQDMVQIGSGYSTRLDAAAFVVGPGGLAFDPASGTLYVASEAEKVNGVEVGTIFAIPDAGTTTTENGKGTVVYADAAHLHGPMGLALAPNGNLIVANTDAVNADPNQPSELVEFTKTGQFVGQFSVDPATGGAFGLAAGTIDGQFRLAAVDDNAPNISFYDFDPTSGVPDIYTATINWGDGTTSAGTVSVSGDQFTVSGSHTYAADGQHTLTAAIADQGGSTATATTTAQAGYLQVNLVSDQAGNALITDPNLVNPWGVAFSPTSPFWISDNGSNVATIYSGDVNGSPFSKAGLVVSIPGGAPTGTVANTTNDFVIGSGSTAGAAKFIFASENGTITAWNPAVSATQAQTEATVPGAVYKGLALANNGTANELFATNFAAGTIDVFNASFQQVALPTGSFTDPNLPAGFAPFGIQLLNGKLYVTYAKQDAAKHDDVAGFGNGFIDVYNTSGTLLERLVTGTPGDPTSPLNSPWGMTIAPANFGDFAGDLLVGNFGNGKINAFDPNNGMFMGTVTDASGNPIVIDGLWNLVFGNGTAAGNTNTLFFTAGTGGEQHGLFGELVSAENTPLAGDGASLSGTEGSTLSGTIATFTPSLAGAVASDFSTTINWGDGSTSAGTIVANGDGGFNVLGSHKFAEEGTESVAVAINDAADDNFTMSASAVIQDAPLNAVGAASVTATGTAINSATVATFTDTGGAEAVANYSATINWGDGTSSAGTVTLSGSTFSVAGSHTYATAGAHSITTLIKDEGGSTATATASTSSGYLLLNLVSDQPGDGLLVDPNLVNPWGVAFSPTGPFWIADNGSDVATIYSGDVNGSPLSRAGLVVSIPGGAPTGEVANTTSDFVVGSGSSAGPAKFIFASENGTITAWGSGSAAQTEATVAAAVYKGLVLANNGTANELFATNFAAGTIDVFDASFHQVALAAGAFSDPNLPTGFAPFGIQLLNGKLYVSYAKQDAAKHDDVAGFGNGFIDVYNTSGTLLERLVTGTPGDPTSPVDSPWGMTIAPANFGAFSGDLLVGNFGNGKINAFDPNNGTFLGTVSDTSGNPIVIDGLWSLVFGNGTAAGSTNTLFFTAGTGGEQHGTFGELINAQDTPLAGEGAAVTPTEGATFSGTVATFASSTATAQASNFTATIDWGDGASSAGTVVANPEGGFNVVGAHLYAEEATDAIQVTVTDNASHSVTIAASAKVADAPLSAQGETLTAAVNDTSPIVVATFTDAGGAEAIANYTATINWGDGSSASNGVITFSNGTFTVTGTHPYQQPGDDTITVSISDEGGSKTSATSQIVVASTANLSVTASGPATGQTGTPLTFTFTITNSGGTAAAGATLTSTLPAGLTNITAVDAAGTVNVNGNTVADTLGSLAAGSSETLTITATPAGSLAGASVTDTATLTFNASTQTASATTSIGSVTSPPPVPTGVGYLAGVPGDGTPQTFVRNLYVELLGREPEAAGDAFWIGLLQAQNNAATRADVIGGFLNSPEYKTHYITTLYQLFLGRAPDQPGLVFWIAKMGDPGTPGGHSGSADEKSILGAFLGSDELFIKSGSTAEGWIDTLYQDLLGRAPDPAGLNFWMNDLAIRGADNRDAVARDFLSAPEVEHDLLDAAFPAAGTLAAAGTQAGTGSTALAELTGGGWENLYLEGPSGSAPEGNDSFFAALAGGAGWDDVQALILDGDQFYDSASA